MSKNAPRAMHAATGDGRFLFDIPAHVEVLVVIRNGTLNGASSRAKVLYCRHQRVGGGLRGMEESTLLEMTRARVKFVTISPASALYCLVIVLSIVLSDA